MLTIYKTCTQSGETGIAIQCLVDLHKAGVVDVKAELDTAIEYQYAMITGSYSGEVIGAPMHSMDGHECSLVLS
jgi:hypothetical protein